MAGGAGDVLAGGAGDVVGGISVRASSSDSEVRTLAPVPGHGVRRDPSSSGFPGYERLFESSQAGLHSGVRDDADLAFLELSALKIVEL